MISSWYSIIKADETKLPDALADFDQIFREGTNELNVAKGDLISEVSRKLAAKMAYYYTVLQEIDAILEHFEGLFEYEKAAVIHHALKTNKHALPYSAVEKLANGDKHIYAIAQLIRDVKLQRNKMFGVVKGLETLQWQLGNITKLRVGGIEDATL